MVMKRLGLEEESPIGGPQDFVGLDEIEGLFEEEEPSFGEIKEAFDVFDQNRDGKIDALEMHRVLSSLGLLKGGSHSKDLEICMKILGGFDHKGVDFNTKFVQMAPTPRKSMNGGEEDDDADIDALMASPACCGGEERRAPELTKLGFEEYK
ncbi:hypothetical protein V2J09_019976 [Rumex salicifolius]